MGSDPPQHQPDSTSSMMPGLGFYDQHGPIIWSNSPEPLSEEDITRMKSRMVDMGLGLDCKPQNTISVENISQREKELGGMVTRLLHSFVDPVQLHRQAEFITWLATQRNHLIQSFKEERQRWEAERESWTRMAEALLSQRARAVNSSQKDEDLERQCAAYEAENKHLREKLQDSHSRFSALESELNKLKPLLLMQPPFPYTSPSFKRLSTSQAGHSVDTELSKAGQKTVDSTPVDEPEQNDSETTSIKGPSTPQPQTRGHADLTRSQLSSNHYKRHSRVSVLSPLHSRMSSHSTPGRSIFSSTPTPSNSSKKLRSRHRRFLSSNLPPLSADARTEHLLLAARKLGRERAHTMSGFMRRVEKEKEDFVREREGERLDRGRSDKTATVSIGGSGYYRKDLVDLSTSPGSSAASTMPRTPKRGSAGGQHTTHFLTPTLMTPRSDLHQPTNQTPNSFIFVSTPVTGTHQTSTTSTPRAANRVIQPTTKPARTPSASSTSTSHPTPLASLLSAAKSMMDDESHESSPTSNSRRRAVVLEPPDSPLSKRRKVGNGNLSNGRSSVDMASAVLAPGSDRVRSALDVLADQAAAAFDSDRQSPVKPPVKPTAKNKAQDKGKGSARVLTRSSVRLEEEREVESSPKGRARTDSHSRTNTGSPLSTRSRSKGIPKESTKILRHRKSDKSVEMQQRNAPLPRMIFSPGARSSVPPPLVSLSPPPSPTPPSTTFGEDKATADSIPLVIAESSTTDSSNASRNSTAPRHSVSPLPRAEDGGQVQPDSPSVSTEEDTRAPGYDAVTPSPLSQSTNQAKDKEPVMSDSTMTSVAETGEEHNPHGESFSGDVPDGKEGTEILDEGIEAQSHAGRNFILDEDEHDTDADAEGEMDVDAEETVFMESSSMTHVPLSLALSHSQLGHAHTIAMGVIDDE